MMSLSYLHDERSRERMYELLCDLVFSEQEIKDINYENCAVL